VSPRREAPLVPDAQPRTYYDEPVLKEPVWNWEIPAYFFTGGLAAGTTLVAAAADLTGDETLAARMEQAALAATGISGALLVADLGQPRRFHHMLRVLKPSSPMNLGAWLLGVFAGGVATAVVTERVARVPGVVRLFRLGTATLAPLLATYTAVLVSDTAVPAWHDARRELPFVFAGGAAASGAGLGLVLSANGSEPALRILLAGGSAMELTATRVMERNLDRSVVGRAFHESRVRMLGRFATVATAAGTALVLSARGHRRVAVAGALSVLAGALAERFAVVAAGRASARDPHAVVDPQRGAPAPTAR